MSHRQLFTVKQFAKTHPAFSQGSLRWLIFNEMTNGLADSGAVLRVGSKVLIDEDRFFACWDQTNGIKAGA